MIEGIVTDNWEPVVRITLCSPDGFETEIEAVVDTGFNGYLGLDRDAVEELQFPWRRTGLAVLADGSESVFDIHEGHVEWQGELRRIPVDVADTTPLIGMRLLQQNQLTVFASVGGAVLIRTRDDLVE